MTMKVCDGREWLRHKGNQLRWRCLARRMKKAPEGLPESLMKQGFGIDVRATAAMRQLRPRFNV